MSTVRPITAINFSDKRDKELIQKLNAVAPYVYRKVHDLARQILLKKLNELIEEHGIDIYDSQAQSARVG